MVLYTCNSPTLLFMIARLVAPNSYNFSTVFCNHTLFCTTLELMNVALKREASISSVFESDYTEAWRAVDGSLDVQHPYCAHTADGDTEPWLLIDLGQTAVILTVKILNRDMCGRLYQRYQRFSTCTS